MKLKPTSVKLSFKLNDKDYHELLKVKEDFCYTTDAEPIKIGLRLLFSVRPLLKNQGLRLSLYENKKNK